MAQYQSPASHPVLVKAMKACRDTYWIKKCSEKYSERVKLEKACQRLPRLIDLLEDAAQQLYADQQELTADPGRDATAGQVYAYAFEVGQSAGNLQAQQYKITSLMKQAQQTAAVVIMAFDRYRRLINTPNTLEAKARAAEKRCRNLAAQWRTASVYVQDEAVEAKDYEVEEETVSEQGDLESDQEDTPDANAPDFIERQRAMAEDFARREAGMDARAAELKAQQKALLEMMREFERRQAAAAAPASASAPAPASASAPAPAPASVQPPAKKGRVAGEKKQAEPKQSGKKPVSQPVAPVSPSSIGSAVAHFQALHVSPENDLVYDDVDMTNAPLTEEEANAIDALAGADQSSAGAPAPSSL